MKHLGDITKISGSEAPVVDCVIGGSPCQDLSVAGKRAGLAGARSGLYMEQIRIIKEMRRKDELRGRSGVAVRPRYMVWENVPGAFSSNGGKDFAAVLEEAIRVSEPEAPAVCAVGCDVYNLTMTGDVTASLTTSTCATGSGPAVIAGGFKEHQSAEARGIGFAEEVAPTLSAQKHDASVCYGINGDIAGTLVASYYKGCGMREGTERDVVMVPDVAHTLRAKGNCDFREDSETYITCQYIDTTHADDVVRVDSVVAPLQARDHKGGKMVLQYIVRRLTPLECERLQGFPDGWTDIGDWVDSKGRVRKTTDSARYKALGNSIAIPPWKWLLKRLCGCYERDATMASLFDGIGGFPLIWEQLNGRGSCLWSSEIEEFPMAVTRVRFGE